MIAADAAEVLDAKVAVADTASSACLQAYTMMFAAQCSSAATASLSTGTAWAQLRRKLLHVCRQPQCRSGNMRKLPISTFGPVA